MIPRCTRLFWSLLLFGVLAPPSEVSAQSDTPLALRSVTVVDIASGALVPDRTVLIVGSRIRAVGHADSVRIPPEATILEGEGKYVIPGLVDAHVHLFNNVSRRPPNTWALPLFIAHGVTGVREMWTEFDAMPTVEAWRRSVSAGELIAPRVLAAGALVEGPGARTANMPEVGTRAEGRRFVRTVYEVGLDFVKVYDHLVPEVYRAILDEAHTVGLPVAGHVPMRVRAVEAAQAGQRTNEHLVRVREACTLVDERLLAERLAFYAEPYDEDEEWPFLDRQVHETSAAFDDAACVRVARALSAAGQWQVPTLVNERRWFLGAPHDWDRAARLEALPPSERAAWARSAEGGGMTYEGDSLSLHRGWEATLRVVEVLGREGVGFLTGTDYGSPFVFPGASVHEEMALLVEAGLTPLHALQAATLNPARYLDRTDDLGTVAERKLADLVLLDANPLEDIANTQAIHAVVLNGRLLRRADLDALLATDPSD